MSDKIEMILPPQYLVDLLQGSKQEIETELILQDEQEYCCEGTKMEDRCIWVALRRKLEE